MENLPVVSVISPVYNHESYISECIRSVQDQSFGSWEMIIIDDGSSDRTAEIVKFFAAKDNRIRYFRQENVGIFRLAETYNKAVSFARGKYMAILEGDDLWMPDKLERQVAHLANNPLVVVAWGQAECLLEIEGKVSGIRPEAFSKKDELLNNYPTGNILNLLYIENPIPAATVIIRKDILDRIGGFQQSHGLPLVDLPTLMALARVGPFWFDRHVLARWREYGLQVTKTYPVEILLGRKQLSLEHFDSNPFHIRPVILVKKEVMEAHYNDVLQIAYSRSGRYKLIRKDFKGARKDFLKAIFFKGFSNISWRIRAITGLFFSFFRTDMESFAERLGRVSYKNR